MCSKASNSAALPGAGAAPPSPEAAAPLLPLPWHPRRRGTVRNTSAFLGRCWSVAPEHPHKAGRQPGRCGARPGHVPLAPALLRPRGEFGPEIPILSLQEAVRSRQPAPRGGVQRAAASSLHHFPHPELLPRSSNGPRPVMLSRVVHPSRNVPHLGTFAKLLFQEYRGSTHQLVESCWKRRSGLGSSSNPAPLDGCKLHSVLLSPSSLPSALSRLEMKTADTDRSPLQSSGYSLETSAEWCVGYTTLWNSREGQWDTGRERAEMRVSSTV